jgi:hypothetical protein
MAGIIEVILADHKRIRGLLRAVDDAARYGEDPHAGWMPAAVWCRLAGLLELRAEAEEQICYLALLGQGGTRPRRCRTRRLLRGPVESVRTSPVLRCGDESRLRPAGQQCCS